MHFNEQCIGAGGERGARHGRNLVAQTGSMRRVRGNRQVRQLVDNRNRRNVERVARIGLEGPNAPFAQDNLIVAARHDVFSREQQFFDGGGDAPLQQHRLADLAQFAQQVEVLHVARTHLEDVDVGQHQLDLRNLHDFADHHQPVAVAGFTQQLQRLQPKTLKGVGRTARLESTAPQDFRACFAHHVGSSKELFLRFDRAWASHHHHFLAADFHSVGQPDRGAVRTKASPHQLVRRTDAVHVMYAGKHFDVADVEVNAAAHRAQYGLPRTGAAVYLEAHFYQVINDTLDLVFARGFQHRNNHDSLFARHLSLCHPERGRVALFGDLARTSRRNPYNLKN